MIFGGANL